MNLLYAHDHMFYVYNDEYYSNGSFPKNVLLRYTRVFEHVNFISRQKVVNKKLDKMSLANTERVHFVEVPNFKSIKEFYKIFEAKKIIEEEVKKADCLISRLPSSIGSLAIKYAMKHNKPYLIEVVGCAWDALWNYGNIQGKIIAPFEFFKTKKLIKNSKYTLYITKNFLQSRYPSYGKICICPNVNIKRVDEKILLNRIRMIENIEEKKELKFGLIGSLDVDYKGHETVIKSLALIKDKIPRFTVEFLGRGNPERWIKLCKKYNVAQNVKFIGTLPSGDAVYKWLDSVDISLQPSKAEAQGRSIIEAMSRGCPVVASKVGGIIELIDNRFLIEPNNYFELADKIIKLLNNIDLLKEQARRNFEESKLYYQDVIDNTREKFFIEFKKFVDSKINNNVI